MKDVSLSLSITLRLPLIRETRRLALPAVPILPGHILTTPFLPPVASDAQLPHSVKHGLPHGGDRLCACMITNETCDWPLAISLISTAPWTQACCKRFYHLTWSIYSASTYVVLTLPMLPLSFKNLTLKHRVILGCRTVLVQKCNHSDIQFSSSATVEGYRYNDDGDLRLDRSLASTRVLTPTLHLAAEPRRTF